MTGHQSRFIHQIPAQLRAVFQTAIDRFQLGEMSLHGPAHWMRVFQNATLLAEETADADLDVCQNFALLHDCERWNEGADPEHGARAAMYAMELQKSGLVSLSTQQMAKLCEACTHHASGRVSSDPTVGVCWDADRLDLPRVGAAVDRKYLSTMAAKNVWWIQ